MLGSPRAARPLHPASVVSSVIVAAGLLCGCGGHAQATRHLLRVPSQYRTIQRAVDASGRGDTILIAPGVYHEAVTVAPAHSGLTIRGENRNTVILDGRSGLLVNGITVHADDVAVENLTVRRYAINGLVFAPRSGAYGTVSEPISGWRGSYLTAYDNGLYGVYAFQAQGGEFDHVYASGQPDSGIYVGQCRPCRASVSSSIAADNAVGYEDTDATGVTVTGSTMRANRIGALLDSNSKEKMAPQSFVTLRRDSLLDNDNPGAPTGDQGFGVGVVVSGGDNDLIEHNRIGGQPVGVAVLNAPVVVGGWQATDNRVRSNSILASTLALELDTGSTSQGNCFAKNHSSRSWPKNLQQAATCGRSVALHGTAPALPANPPPVDFLKVAAPPPQPSMPARPSRGR